MVVRHFAVIGLTCGMCLAALLEELHQVEGVQEAAADLAVGGATSVVVTTRSGVLQEQLHEAVERAGFKFASTDRLAPPHRGSEHLLAAEAFVRAGAASA